MQAYQWMQGYAVAINVETTVWAPGSQPECPLTLHAVACRRQSAVGDKPGTTNRANSWTSDCSELKHRGQVVPGAPNLLADALVGNTIIVDRANIHVLAVVA